MPGTFAYTPAAGTVLGVGTHTLSVTLIPTDSNDYQPVTATTSIVVSLATPTLTWNAPASITYGTALGSAQLDARAGVPGSFAYTPAAGTVLGAGTQTLSVTFTPADLADYTTATTTTRIVVSQAAPTITWSTPRTIVYGTALGVNQLDATADVPGTFAYTPAVGAVLGAGVQTLSVTFTPTDSTDYTTATATTRLVVSQATPALTWSAPAPIVYGTAAGAQAQLDARTGVPGTFAYTPAAGTVPGAGAQTLSVTFTPTDSADYTTATITTTITVEQATPILTWNAPAAIVYGTALGVNQLDATASVPGTFAYAPATGTIPGRGLRPSRSPSRPPTPPTTRRRRRRPGSWSRRPRPPSPGALRRRSFMGRRRTNALRARRPDRRAGDLHLLPRRGHRAGRGDPDTHRHLHAHRFGRLHDGDSDHDDRRLAGHPHDHLDCAWRRSSTGQH